MEKCPRKNTESYALAVEDPDASSGIWYHWLVANIPKSKTSIKKNEIPGKQVLNSWNIKNYKGPKPPKGEPHRYYFKIFALNVEKISADDIESFDKAINEHKIAEASIMGRYQTK